MSLKGIEYIFTARGVLKEEEWAEQFNYFI